MSRNLSVYEQNFGNEAENLIAKTLLTERERILLPLLFEAPEKKTTEEYRKTVERLTDYMSIDNEHISFLLMLAILGERMNWEAFPKEIIPRLKGIYRYYLVQNLAAMRWLMENVRILQAAGIKVMFIKGLAMRCYYTSGIARIMSDYDIAVPRNRFREAMDLLKGNNNRFKSTTTYSDTVLGSVNGKTVELDVHQWIFKNQGDADNGIWKRAIPIKVLDTTVLVPCPADMLIHQMHNQCGNIFNMEHPDNHMKWLFDCRHIQLGDLVNGTPYSLDPEELRKRAASFHATFTTRLMLKLYASCFGEEFSLLAEQIQPTNKDYVRWLKITMERHYFLQMYDSFGYDEVYGPLTPDRMRMSLKKSFIDYRLYRSEHSGMAHKRTWGTWLLWEKRVDNFTDLREKYLVRIKDMILRKT